MELLYNNPIIHMDFSDPDVIRVNDDFYMVASSFNMVPGIPILHSKNLVEWEIINYVFDKIPFERFDKVCHGDGAWAPSLRYHNNKFYCVIPFPDEGVYVSETSNIYAKWSDLRCLIDEKGIIDPCPIWDNDKCYLVVGFAKSRIGFNSVLGLYEVDNDLTHIIKDYKIIYDGHNNNPTIEGPKFNKRNGYYYIMAPAGSVKTGWQVALRSKDIYGPYESKIVLLQNDTKINGPHQGALIDIDNNDNWAFIHFQDKGCYGRITHLEPVKWINDWPLCGNIKDPLLGGSPVNEGRYPINIKTDYKIICNDDFKSKTLLWQTPSNINNFYEYDNGLKMYALYDNESTDKLHLLPYKLLQKIIGEKFNISVNIDLSNMQLNDECGLIMLGSIYNYIAIKKEDGYKLYIGSGSFNEKDSLKYISNVDCKVTLNVIFMENGYYKLGFNDIIFNDIFKAYPGRWVSTFVGLYNRGIKNSKGYVVFNDFKME